MVGWHGQFPVIGDFRRTDDLFYSFKITKYRWGQLVGVGKRFDISCILLEACISRVLVGGLPLDLVEVGSCTGGDLWRTARATCSVASPAARSLSTGLPLCPEAMATAGGLDLTSSLRWAGTCTSLHYEYEFLSISLLILFKGGYKMK